MTRTTDEKTGAGKFRPPRAAGRTATATEGGQQGGGSFTPCTTPSNRAARSRFDTTEQRTDQHEHYHRLTDHTKARPFAPASSARGRLWPLLLTT